MKKVKNALLSIFLIVTMLLLLFIQAHGETVYTYRINDWQALPHPKHLTNNCTNYYSILINNFGHNVAGTCTYVAMGMLLSFYDSYYDDDFIDENFDVISVDEAYSGIPNIWGSPGVIYEAQTYNNYISTTDNPSYMDFVNRYSSTSFQLNLISMANSYPLNFYTSRSSGGGEDDYAINEAQFLKLMQTYISQRNSASKFSNSGVSIGTLAHGQTYNNKSMQQIMIEKITSGIPVICIGYNYTLSARVIEDPKSAHAMVAFDYDGSNVYVHKGYHNSINRFSTISSSGYPNIGRIIWLELGENFQHEHSNNYKRNGSFYCGCGALYNS